MGRIIAWVFIIVGGVILGFNAYKWWDEINIAIKDPKLAMELSDDWQETQEEPSLTSVENFLAEDNHQNDSNKNTEENTGGDISYTETQSVPDLGPNAPNTTNNNNNINTNNQIPNESGQNQTNSTQGGGNQVGELIIPKIGAYLPIIEGTDDQSLSKGVGKYIGHGTVSPNQTGHAVLSGHRDTVFRKTGDLEIGDKIYYRYQGRVYTYQIRTTWVTDAEDRTVIVPIDKPVLSLTTCYPFDFIGNAPDRYIIRADLIGVKNDA